MISNDLIQASLVSYLKSQASIIALLSTSSDIKEDQWQGTYFVYPAIRVALGVQNPIPGVQCTGSKVTVSILCFSENASSQEADIIAGTVNEALYQKAFEQSGVRFSMIRSIGLVPAIRQDERTWRSEAQFEMIVE